MGKRKRVGGVGLFTHPEWMLRGKRPRLKLLLACGKVLPEDATNLRIIDGDSVTSELNHCLDIGGPSLGAPEHLQSGAGFPLGDNPGELPAGLFGLFRGHPFQNRAYCEKVNV